MQPHGLSCQENVVKECGEEASIPPELAAKAIPTGVVSYTADQPEGCKRDVLFCYDLELPEDFQPKPLVGARTLSKAYLCHDVLIYTDMHLQHCKIDCVRLLESDPGLLR